MLARPATHRCIECGLPLDAPGFQFHGGKRESGPAYWSDRGVLCSPRCSVNHTLRRRAESSLPDRPAPDPFELTRSR
jgi:hypothetical protein